MDLHRDKWPEMRMKHLELIQAVIARMGTNTSGLKGYCMAMSAAIIGLSASVSKEQILLYTLPIVFAFSLLDAVYLSLERGLRGQYNSIRQLPLDSQPDFEISPQTSSLFSAFFSWSVAGFYSVIVLIMIIVSLLMPEIVKAT